MPSRRMIDPAFWESETITQLGYFDRLFFIGLFSQADDQGRLKANPALLRSKIFPYDDIPLSDITEAMDRLRDLDSVIVYINDRGAFIQIANWWRYQKPRWAWPSKLPAPEGWEDRLAYRVGNRVIYRNWPDTEDTPEPGLDESGATVVPERAHSGATVAPAPSNSNSNRNSGSGSGRDSGSGSNRSGDPDVETAPLAPVAGTNSRDIPAITKRLAEIGVGEPMRSKLAAHAWVTLPLVNAWWKYIKTWDNTERGVWISSLINRLDKRRIPPAEYMEA